MKTGPQKKKRIFLGQVEVSQINSDASHTDTDTDTVVPCICASPEIRWVSTRVLRGCWGAIWARAQKAGHKNNNKKCQRVAPKKDKGEKEKKRGRNFHTNSETETNTKSGVRVSETFAKLGFAHNTMPTRTKCPDRSKGEHTHTIRERSVCQKRPKQQLLEP